MYAYLGSYIKQALGSSGAAERPPTRHAHGKALGGVAEVQRALTSRHCMDCS